MYKINNLRKEYKNYITQKIFDTINSSSKILIMDDNTEIIIANCFSEHELNNNNIFGLYKITESRKNIVSSDAIYFVSSSNDNIKFIISDWTNNKKYKSANIFFSTKTINSLINKLTEIKDNIKNLYDMQICDMRMNDISCVNFNYNHDFINCNNNYAEKCNNYLMNLFSILKINPNIISYNTEISTNIANIFLNTIKDTNYKMTDSILLILDRSYDVILPLLENYSYETLCEKNTQKIKFDCEEEMWIDMKDLHITECPNKFNMLLEIFENKYPNIKKYQENRNKNINTKSNISDICDITTELASYDKEKKKISIHNDVLKKLIDVYENSDLQIVDSLENRIIANKKDEKLLDDIRNFIKYTKGNQITKKRIIMLYTIIHKKKIDDIGDIDFNIISILKNIKYNRDFLLENCVRDIIIDKKNKDFTYVIKTKSSLRKQNCEYVISKNTIALQSPKKIIVFIAGGMTKHEKLLAYKLTNLLKHEIIIASTSLINPEEYCYNLLSQYGA
jgi:hypothetical protein